MKIVALSDTHGFDFTDRVPECDILLLAGDISPVNLDHSFYSQQQWFINTFIKQLKQLTSIAKNIVFIGGNHDTYLSEVNISKNNDIIHNLLPDNVYYLCDSEVTINKIKIYGSPWCNLPSWGRQGPPVWNFAKNEKDLDIVYDNIPNDIDILLTHGPCFGFCDVILDENVIDINRINYNSNPERLGSKSLRNRIIKGVNAKYVISGHIHSANHKYEVYKPDLAHDGIKFACASILNENYKFSEDIKPLIIQWEN